MPYTLYMNNATHIADANIYNTHRNDEPSFAFNGAARKVAFGAAALVNSRVPVRVVPGKQAPELQGESGGHFTLSGEPIQYPSAYRKAAFSNMTYRCDSRAVVVGADWRPW